MWTLAKIFFVADNLFFVENNPNKVFWPALGCAQHPKAGQNTQPISMWSFSQVKRNVFSIVVVCAFFSISWTASLRWGVCSLAHISLGELKMGEMQFNDITKVRFVAVYFLTNLTLSSVCVHITRFQRFNCELLAVKRLKQKYVKLFTS